MKESGIGREGSKYGIEEFLEVKYLCMGLVVVARLVMCLAGLKEDDSDGFAPPLELANRPALRTRRDLLADTARVHRHPTFFDSVNCDAAHTSHQRGSIPNVAEWARAIGALGQTRLVAAAARRRLDQRNRRGRIE
jgi:hypothetical protein